MRRRLCGCCRIRLAAHLRGDGTPVCHPCLSAGRSPTPAPRSTFDLAARLGPPEPLDRDVDAELLACLGEGPGPDEGPDPVDPRDTCHDEKLVRLRRYHADVTGGRPISFVNKDLLLSPAGRLACLRDIVASAE